MIDPTAARPPKTAKGGGTLPLQRRAGSSRAFSALRNDKISRMGE
jgi:hypothetical protein